ncbi:MAG: hypothetical protein PHO37_17215 [Kiritimatiellae bacterium]|nr:hypothetical protein [Kiritimatiellia bacterium]
MNLHILLVLVYILNFLTVGCVKREKYRSKGIKFAGYIDDSPTCLSSIDSNDVVGWSSGNLSLLKDTGLPLWALHIFTNAVIKVEYSECARQIIAFSKDKICFVVLSENEFPQNFRVEKYPSLVNISSSDLDIYRTALSWCSSTDGSLYSISRLTKTGIIIDVMNNKNIIQKSFNIGRFDQSYYQSFTSDNEIMIIQTNLREWRGYNINKETCLWVYALDGPGKPITLAFQCPVLPTAYDSIQNMLVLADENKVVCLDGSTGVEINRHIFASESKNFYFYGGSIAIAPGGSQIALGENFGGVQIWGLPQWSKCGNLVRENRQGKSKVLCFKNGNKQLVTRGILNTSSFEVWDLEGLKNSAEFKKGE